MGVSVGSIYCCAFCTRFEMLNMASGLPEVEGVSIIQCTAYVSVSSLRLESCSRCWLDAGRELMQG